MFAMANAVKMQHGDVGTLESKLFEVETGFKVTIPYETQAKSVRINGFEEADEASNGCFAVTVSESGTPSTVITFLEGNVAVGDTIRVAYRRRVNTRPVPPAWNPDRMPWGCALNIVNCLHTQNELRLYVHLFGVNAPSDLWLPTKGFRIF